MEDWPTCVQLYENYPNPFNPLTTIRYGLPNRSHVALTVYNTLGQRVALLQNGEQEAGYHEVMFDGRGLSSGVYYYRIQAGDFVQTRNLLLLR
jgi:flagellar hook assembly protein FlgD